MQMPGILGRRMVVISGGSSAPAGARRPNIAAAGDRGSRQKLAPIEASPYDSLRCAAAGAAAQPPGYQATRSLEPWSDTDN